jgi:hypothetical protein
MPPDRNNTVTIKPIETRAYRYRFRSRLEARWAVAFTEARIEWEYEPEGFDLGDAGLYLPDFWLPQVSMWAEVKAGRPTAEEVGKAEALARQSDFPCLLLVGPPAACAYWAIHPQLLWINVSGTESGDLAVMDYCPFEGSDYHLKEARFFGNCGEPGDFPMPFDPGFGSHPAIEAALSARFEHGETP